MSIRAYILVVITATKIIESTKYEIVFY